MSPQNSEALEASHYPGGLLRGIQARKAFKNIGGIEFVQAVARRYLAQRIYPVSHDVAHSIWRSYITLEAFRPEGVIQLQTAARRYLVQKRYPSIHHNLPRIRAGLERTLLQLDGQVQTVGLENSAIRQRILDIEQKIEGFQAAVLRKESTVADTLARMEICVPRIRFERQMHNLEVGQRELESSIAHEAAGKGHILQLRSKIHLREKYQRSKSVSSIIPRPKTASEPDALEAEQAIQDALTRAQRHLVSATTQQTSNQTSPQNLATPSSSRVTFGRTRRNPLDTPETGGTLPRPLFPQTGTGTLSSLPPPPSSRRTPRRRTKGMSVPPPASGDFHPLSSILDQNKRHTFVSPPVSAVPEPSLPDPSELKERLAVFYNTPRPTALKPPEAIPSQISLPRQTRNVTRPIPIQTPYIPSYASELLDAFSDPVSSDITALHIPSPTQSPTRGSWDLIRQDSLTHPPKSGETKEPSKVRKHPPPPQKGKNPPARPTGWLKGLKQRALHPESNPGD